MSRPWRIALVEPAEHVEVLDYALAVLGDITSCRAYISSRCKVPQQSAELHQQQAEQDFVEFLREHERALQETDVIIFISVRVDPRSWQYVQGLNRPMLAFVHNANFQLAATVSIAATLKDALRRLHWRCRGWWQHRRLSPQVWTGLIVANSRMAAIATAAGFEGKVLILPWAVSPALVEKGGAVGAENAELRVVVPGTVRIQNRHWQPVMEAVALLHRSLTLVLVGEVAGSAGQRQVEELQAAARANVCIVTWPQALAPADYWDQLAAADLLLLPLTGRAHYATVAEVGGCTKISGAEHDQLAAGKLALVDASYSGNAALRQAQQTYATGQELAALLNGFPGSLAHLHPARRPLEVHRVAWGKFLTRLLGER